MSTLHWASPIRQHGLRELPSIPNEICLEIMSYLKPSDSHSADSGSLTQDLRNVARVCRFFCSIALPWIFESFCLVIGRDGTGSGPENRTKFCRRLLNGEEAAQTVARFVKKCTFSLSALYIGSEWALQELLSMYSKAIAHMPNIEETILSKVIIKKDTLKSLSKLKCLKTLQITHCQLAPDVKERHLAKISTLRLSSLDISFPSTIDLPMDASNPNIVSFLNQINWSCISKFTATTIPTIIQSAWMSSKGLPLVELDLFCIEMAPLLRLLAKTPSLRLLRVANILPPQQTPPDSSGAPMLEELEAPLPLCMMLVPGRPVANLSLKNVRWEGPVLGPTEASIFQTASCPISQLKVPLEFYLNAPFWRHFPLLRVLRLDTLGQGAPIQKTISKFIESWPRHPCLHTLTLENATFWGDKQFLNLGLQYSSIKSHLMPKFPALRTCRLSEHIEWHYNEANALWKPTIPNPHIYEVREFLQSVGDNYVVYFDNCLKGV